MTSGLFAQLGNVTGISSDATSITLNVGSDVVKVRMLLPNVAEVDYRPGGVTSVNTLILDPTHAAKVWAPGTVNINTASDPATLTTSAIQVRVQKNPLRISYYTTGGQLIFKEQNSGGMSGNGVKFDGWTTNSLNWYGLQSAGSGRAWEGTPAGTYWGWTAVNSLIRQGVTAGGSRYVNPSMNVMPHGGQTGPFVWTLGNASIPGFAVLWDNEGGTATLGNSLEMSKTGARGTPELNPKTNTLWFAIVGSPYQIMDGMTQITGRPSMFPKYASGFINTEWGVDENELKASIQTYRARKIPLDVYTLDFDWKYWGEFDNGEFIWNPEKFPNAANGKLKDFFTEQGNYIMGITKPRIHRNTPQGDEAFANGWFNSQTGPGAPVDAGNDYFSGKPAANLKFSLQAVRTWFAQKTIDGAYATGVSGWWNDEYEETDIMDGAAGNVYNPALQKEIYSYQRSQFPSSRVWSNNRTSYLGSHRYGYSVWSGDVFARWGQLQVEPVRMLQTINAGLGRTSTDGGGTSGSAGGVGDDTWDGSNQNAQAAHMPVPELYARWIQFSSFMPIFRTHGANPMAQRQPWYFNNNNLGANSGNGERGAVEAIRFRSKLIPYIYSNERRYAETGVPIVRPLNWDNAGDAGLVNYSGAWMFGDGLLVSPVLVKQSSATSKQIYLPAGTWYDYFRGTTYTQGSGGNITYDVTDPLWVSMPVFAKAGAIIPNYFNSPQYVGEGDQTQLQVDYFPSTTATSFNYYDDDGKSYGYESNQFFKQTITGQQAGTTVNVTIGARTGATYTPLTQHYIVAIQRFKASSVTVGGGAATARTDLNALRNTAGEGWTTGANSQGAVTYVKVASGSAKTIAATQASAPSLSIVTTSLPNALINTDYDVTLSAEGLGNTVSWSLSSGTLPSGLIFDAKRARIYGRATAAGTTSLTFQLASGGTVTSTLSLTTTAPALLAYEPFEYASIGYGLEAAQGGTGFSEFWERKIGSFYDNPKYPTFIDFGSTTYGTLPFAGHSAKLIKGAAGNRYSRLLESPFVDDNSAKTVWLSFTGTGFGAGTGGLSLTKTAGGTTDSLLVFGKVAGSTNWSYDAKVGSQPSAASSVAVSSTPALILVKISVTNSSTRTVRMWVNPPVSGTAPADASANIITNQGSNNLSFGRIELMFEGVPVNDALVIDEVRLGTNYTDVMVLNQAATVWKPQNLTQGVTASTYNYQLISSGSPTSYNLTGGSLPTGLSFNTNTGIISGTPTTAGTYTMTFTATNANGTGSPTTLKIVVVQASAPVITQNQTATGQVGLGFSYNLQSTGFPTSWSVVSGSLPAGINLAASTGVVSGTPTSAGVYAVTFGASNAQGSATNRVATFTVTAPLAGFIYDQIGGSIGASAVGLGGGGGTIGWGSNLWQNVNAGPKTIVPGLTYPGVPTAGNAIEVDSNGYAGVVRQFASAIQRNNQTTWVSFLAKVSRSGTNGIFIVELLNDGGTQFQILTETGVANWKFGRSSSTVATNSPVVNGETVLVLLKMDMAGNNSTYRIWINPPTSTQPSDASANGTITGSSNFDYNKIQTIQFDSVSDCYIDEIRLGAVWADVMGAAPVIAAGQNPSAMQTIPFNYQVQSNPAATSWSILSGSLPSGLSFNSSTGVISGTVTTTGSFPVTLTATNAIGTSGQQTVNISAVALANPSISAGQTTTGIVGTAFNYQITASYAISYALSSGSLPPGLTLNTSTGVMSGTPTTVGNYTPQFTATNSSGTSSPVGIAISVTQLLAYEGFNYTAGVGALANKNGGTGWTSAWDAGSNDISATGLTYTSGSNALTVSNGRAIIKDGQKSFRTMPATYSSGTYWMSFIAKSNNPGSGYGGLSLYDGNSEQAFIGQRYNQINWGLEKPGGAHLNTGVGTGANTFIVVKLVLKAGADDIYLWTNPTLGATPPDSTATQWLSAAEATFNKIRLEQGLAGQTLDFDEFRFGNSYAEVAPTGVIVPQAPVITPSQNVSGTINQSFSYTILASNNPSSWTLSSGSLPAGVTLNTSTGNLSGTPTATGSFTPNFTATNVGGTSTAQAVAVTITTAAVPSIAPGQSATGTVNQSFNYTPSVTGSPSSWALAGGALPSGVTLNTSTGLISGTPSATGSFSPSLTATNGAGTSGAQTISLTINTASPATYKIMTYGDSITGFYKYQPFLKTLLTNNGFTYTMVGTQGSAPDNHEGVGGISIGSIDDSVVSKLNTTFGTGAPAAGVRNVIMFQAGVNNMNHGLGISGAQANGFPKDASNNAIAPQFATALNGSFLNGLGAAFGDSSYGTGYITNTVSSLLDKLVNHPSQPWVIVARIAPIGKGNTNYNANTDNCTDRINEYNNILAAKVTALQGQGKTITLIDNFSSAVRAYGATPPSDFGTAAEQGGQNVTNGQASTNNGDWVHPRNAAPIWQTMGNNFYNGLQTLLGNSYSISGTVTLSGSGLIGVNVTDGTRSATTDSSGNYTISGVSNGTFNLTASKAGFTFTPSPLSVTVASANQTGRNFTATALPTYSISGTITLSGTGVSAVTVSDSNGNSTSTDGSGNYTLTGIPQGSYTITPSKPSHAFTPVNRSGTLSANLGAQNFTATFQPATYEAFSYSAGTGALAGKSGGDNWNGAWDSGSNDINAAGLTYSSGGTLTASGGKAVLKDGVASFRNISSSTYANGTYWVSFLAKSSNPGSNWGGLSLYNGTNETIYIGQRFGQNNWGIERSGSGNGVNTSTNTGTVTYLVAKIVLQAGNDTVYLWTNPSLSSTPVDGNATQFTNINDFTFDRIRLQQGLGTGQTMEIDEVRLGNSYAEVAPTGSGGGGSAPVITPNQTASGTQGQAFSYNMTSTNSPTSWALSSGSLPVGVTLNTSTGTLSGTPSGVGNFTPSFTATNATGTSPAQSVSITITAAAAVIHDGFNYAPGAGNLANKTGGNNWSGAWDAGANGIGAVGLTYSSSGTLTASGSKVVAQDSVASYRIMNSNFSTGTVWVSFLAKSSAPSSAWGGVSLLDNTWAEQLFIGQRYGSSNWGIERNGSGSAETSTSTGNVTFVVAKLVLTPGSASVRLWTNPSLSGTPADGTANAVVGSVPDFSFDRIRIMQGLGAAQTLEVDEIRVGLSYSDVAPTAAAAGLVPLVGTGQTVSGTQAQALNYTLIASNSPTSWTLTSGSLPAGVSLNASTGVLSGTPSGSGSFTPSFTATNATGASSAQSVSVTIAAANGLVSFRSSNSLATNGTQDSLTPAGDGVANLLKYAFNMLGAGTGQAVNLTTPNARSFVAGGIAGLPLVNTDGTGKLQISFVRRKAASNSGITYSVEFSNDLAAGSWAVNASATTSIPVSIDANYESVTVTDHLAQSKRFVRVRITTP